MADYIEYDHHQYRDGKIYPLSNPLKQGYGVSDPDVNPAGNRPNGMLLNQQNEKIEFWIEEMKANFGITGSTAQSRTLRQFFPHNVVQPSITVIGRAPNSFQINRMASFVRASHWHAVNAEGTRHKNLPGGKTAEVTTVRLVIRNGHQWMYDGGRAFRNGTRRPNQPVRGIHRAWAIEGYIKSMKAGGQKENQAPQFEFEFFLSDSLNNAQNPNLGIVNDTQVAGAALKPWLDWIKKDGQFVTVNDKQASEKEEPSKQELNWFEKFLNHESTDPLW